MVRAEREREIKQKRGMERERENGRKRVIGTQKERSYSHRQAAANQVKKRTAHPSRPAELLHSLIYNNCKYSTTVES